MKITMYELLGMVKDGKAPKKIKIGNDILTLSKTNIINYNFEQYGQLNWDYYIENYRLDENIVEILDKDFKLEEKKIPEKLETYKEVDDEDCYANILKVSKDGECEIDEATSVIVDKINSIIDYLKSKGDE